MATKRWLLGKHLTAITVATGSDSGGTITWATAVSLANKGDYVSISDDRMLEMIAAVDATQTHYEKTLNDSSLSVGEIRINGTRSVLEAATAIADLIKVVFTMGGTTYTFLGTVEHFGDGVRSYGKNTAELNLKPIDYGTPALSSTFS